MMRKPKADSSSFGKVSEKSESSLELASKLQIPSTKLQRNFNLQNSNQSSAFFIGA
jgi:hypothetical protein